MACYLLVDVRTQDYPQCDISPELSITLVPSGGSVEVEPIEDEKINSTKMWLQVL